MNEIWKDIPNYEGLYQVSNLGNVKSLSKIVWSGKVYYKAIERILKPGINSCGYYTVNLWKSQIKKNKTVHQIVSETFLNHIPNGKKIVINHKDFNKLNNHVNNLEIVTMRENSNKKHLKSSSEYVGVGWHKITNKWISRITINRKLIHLGSFVNEHDAHLAYQNKLKLIQNEN